MYRDGRPEHIRDGVRESLRRLRTDHIDLYQLHRVDEKVPLEETWGAMASLVEEGLVRAIGLSDVRPAEIEKAHAIHPVATVQNELSLWTRDDEVVEWTATHGVGFIPYSPLGRGFLTGRYTSSAEFGADDFRSRLPRFADGALDANLAIVQRVQTVAERHGATPGQIALAWVLATGDQIVPIPGTKRLTYLEENAGAAQVRLTPEDVRELNEIPPPVGTRY
jgi:aryl-alcohol dehydrogenase-like predicted oxidoreductase